MHRYREFYNENLELIDMKNLKNEKEALQYMVMNLQAYFEEGKTGYSKSYLLAIYRYENEDKINEMLSRISIIDE